MPPADEPQTLLEPKHPNVLALAAFVLAALTLCWPMLGGGFLLGDDQYVAGYSYRLFGAEMGSLGLGPLLPIRLMVPEDELLRARDILAD